MLLAVDVHYYHNQAQTAGVLFHDWTDATPTQTCHSVKDDIEPYIPGSFYLRELPCILKLLSDHRLKPKIIIIDGYVFLDGHGQPGLGKYLFDKLKGEIPVIGVAKNPFRDISKDYALWRGESKYPLYVTSVGIDHRVANEYIRLMHGKYRIPTLLKMADQLCRKLSD